MAIKFLDLEGLKKLWSKVKGRIDSAVSAEKSERQAADSSLSGVLTSESERAKNAESKNATAISNEASRAKSAEAKLTADLADESSRAIAKENSLSSALQSETSSRTAKDSVLEESINTESSSRASADTQLQNLIQAISSDYITSAELASAMSSSLTYKGSVNYIDTLPDSHNNGDVYNVVYYGESSQAGTEEWGMNVAWSTADNRWDRLGGVQDLHDYCLKANYMTSSEVALAIANALSEAKSYTYSKSQTDTLLSNANNSINNEKARAQVAEQKNATDISAEVSRAKEAEQKNATDISAEVSRAKEAESNLRTDINSKVKQINIGGTECSPSSGVVSLPEYPTTLPANGGNASTVNGHSVDSNVPQNAKFTDTLYLACSINEYRNSITITSRWSEGDSTHTWTKLATITLESAYVNSPIVFSIISRGYEAPSTVSILFANSPNYNTSIDRFTATFKADFYIKRVAGNKWELYSKSDNVYDYEHVCDVNHGAKYKDILVDVNVQPVEDQDVNNMIKATNIYAYRSDMLSLYPMARADQYNAIKLTKLYERGDGAHKWTRIATIDVLSYYVNTPIVFCITSRDTSAVSIVSICFKQIDNIDPEIYSFISSYYLEYYLKKVSSGKWELYYFDQYGWTRISVHNVLFEQYPNTNILVDVNVCNADDQNVSELVKAKPQYPTWDSVPSTIEQWTFTLEDGSTVAKNICIK